MQTRYHVFMLLVAMLVGRECMAWSMAWSMAWKPPEGYVPPRLRTAQNVPACDLRPAWSTTPKHEVICNSTLLVLTNGVLRDLREENERLLEENWSLQDENNHLHQENTRLRFAEEAPTFWNKEFEHARWVSNDANERDLMLIYLVRNFSKYLGM